MQQSQNKSRLWLILLVIIVVSAIGYLVYANNYRVTCADQTAPKSTATENDNTLTAGQAYTIDGHDGVSTVCSKRSGEVVSETQKVVKVDTKIVKGTKPLPTPVVQAAPAAPRYVPSFNTTPYVNTYTPPKTTNCNPNYIGGYSCTTY